MRLFEIRAEWNRALKSLGAAETLYDQKYYEDSISRAYYAVLHAAKAALLVNEVLAKSHSAVRNLFSQKLATTGKIVRANLVFAPTFSTIRNTLAM